MNKIKTVDVSVIIPAYNQENRLGMAIESVLSQTFSNNELIVVDDGSTDGTANIARAYQKVNLISHAENQGRAAARNTGVQVAKGKYIAFLDSDDEWLPQKLEKQVEYLNEHTDVAVCLTGFYRVTIHGIIQKVQPPSPGSWHKYFIRDCAIADGTVPLIRRECFQEIGLFDVKLARYQNWEWFLRLAEGHKITAIMDLMAIKRQGKRPPAKSKEESALYFVKKHQKTFLRYGLYGSSSIAIKWFDVSISYFHEKNYKKGLQFLTKAIRQNPFQTPVIYLRLADSLFGTSFEKFIFQLRQFFS